ncbi:MAG: CDGSH iron-sulfur domain-containing protein [Candidatus Roizmanbacteria bacterium]|nr:CDGSH iron-sulfur domain-containing protein [Candidatus Roizmanbacteria bacterium]
MARLIIKTEKGPFELKPSEKPVKVCMCGLSKNQPFCDGSHNATLDEKDDELYEYDKKGKRIEMSEEEEGGCCGGGCCGGKDEGHKH